MIKQKDSADSVMVWEDKDENVCPTTNVEVLLDPLSPSKQSNHSINGNGNGNELLLSTPVKEKMSPRSANVSRRHHKVIAVRKQYSKASF